MFQFEIFIFLNVILSLILSLLITILLTNYISKKFLIYINLTGISLSFFNSLLLLIKFLLNWKFSFEIVLMNWFKISTLSIDFALICDKIVILMLFVVTLVSTLVHIYSLEYMRNDPHQLKFLQYLTLFTLAMCVLITANNLIQMFIGWEGVGVCSYLLINFWDTRLQANTSAMKAIIVNRLGDINLLMAFVLIYNQFLTFDYQCLKLLINVYGINSYILLLLFFGAVGKSAQVFLHVWLPDAMEGPTPVSALIHAATMVTAGIFLLIRFSFAFELDSFINKIILVFGSITALFAATVGMCQTDLKKIIAYSTCSQLGFMTAICGLNFYDLALFHLAMHAFFKALLFLSAGSVIHAFKTEEQDIRRMGGLIFYMPVTFMAIVIGSLALMGFPFTAGYYSKDLILEHLFLVNCPVSLFALICCVLASICTTIYSVKLIYYVFFSSSNIAKINLNSLHESSFILLFPLVVLSFFSIFGGFLFKPLFVEEINWFSEELSTFIKLLPSLLVLIVSVISLTFFKYALKFKWFYEIKLIKYLYVFFAKKWYFDVVYNIIFRMILQFLLTFFFIKGDRGFLELMGPLGVVRQLNSVKNFLVKFENLSLKGYMQNFIYNLCIFVIVVVVILIILTIL